MIDRYLLGDVSVAERDAIEKRFFTDAAFMEEILAAEDDLIDAYVRRELSDPDRQRFENHFALAPGRRERIQTARSLLAVAGAQQSPPRAQARDVPRVPSVAPLRLGGLASRWTLAASLVAAVAAASWLLVDDLRLRHDLARAQQDRTALERQQQDLERALADQQKLSADLRAAAAKVEEPPPQGRGAQSSPRIAAFVLLPGLLRSPGRATRLTMPPGIDSATFHLSVETDVTGSTLQVVLRRTGAAEIWRRGNLTIQQAAAGRIVAVTIPARLLTEGEFLMTLTAASAGRPERVVGDYPFTVATR